MLVTALTACGSSAAKESASEKADKDPDQLVFVAIPDEESTTLQQRFKPLIDLLEKETEKKVVIQAATDYAAVIEGQRAGKVDIAQHGPLSYVVARASGVKLTPIGAQVTKRGEDPGYQSYGIVKKDSAIKNLKEFAGQKVCFADPNSTSGYLYPKAALRKVGIDNTKDITEVMAGGQDASVLSVDKGQCDAGFAAEAMVDTLLPGKGSIKKGDLRVVWKSDMIPGSPVTVSDDLSPALRKKITDAFVEKANEDYLRAHGFCTGDACRIGENWGYVPVADADFDSVRDVCGVTRDKQCKNPE
ncbi:phosphate/phosphite/phosphonate ABC transporter substrate-binding protein [Streptomyces parvus]|uniref:phosphate/phosphite/phosphonate ABC transporter substrate-binding protein n=1 Tax=Streptomyces parvus TaxID=66428 RepID=UPI0035DA5ABA